MPLVLFITTATGLVDARVQLAELLQASKKRSTGHNMRLNSDITQSAMQPSRPVLATAIIPGIRECPGAGW